VCSARSQAISPRSPFACVDEPPLVLGPAEPALVDRPVQARQREFGVVGIEHRERMPRGDGEHQQAARAQHAVQLGQRAGLVGDVFEHVQRADRVEGAAGERQRGADPAQREVRFGGAQLAEIARVSVDGHHVQLGLPVQRGP
jgi:hypothetical protein